MKFEIERTFENVSLDHFAKWYFDPEFNQHAAKHIKLRRDVLKREETDEYLKQELKTSPDRELPKFLQRIIRTDRIEYHEKTNYDKKAYQGEWITTPNVMPGKVSTSGGFKFEMIGDTLRWTLHGEIKVKVMAVGSAIEKAVVKNIEESNERYAAYLKQWLQDHPEA